MDVGRVRGGAQSSATERLYTSARGSSIRIGRCASATVPEKCTLPSWHRVESLFGARRSQHSTHSPGPPGPPGKERYISPCLLATCIACVVYLPTRLTASPLALAPCPRPSPSIQTVSRPLRFHYIAVRRRRRISAKRRLTRPPGLSLPLGPELHPLWRPARSPHKCHIHTHLVQRHMSPVTCSVTQHFGLGETSETTWTQHSNQIHVEDTGSLATPLINEILPIEILGIIFEELAKLEWNAPTMDGRVCRLWRQSTLSAPRAWAYLEQGHPAP